MSFTSKMRSRHLLLIWDLTIGLVGPLIPIATALRAELILSPLSQRQPGQTLTTKWNDWYFVGRQWYAVENEYFESGGLWRASF